MSHDESKLLYNDYTMYIIVCMDVAWYEFICIISCQNE